METSKLDRQAQLEALAKAIRAKRVHAITPIGSGAIRAAVNRLSPDKAYQDKEKKQ
ncbi:hypothetical protein [Geomonas ferrireducens]|uniref:hypothetical protein n=1 Tax=Geomonas ferrireducens TaxID=2570227 RepID=UPI0013A5EF86|nr:hypothetical protein [Geomonas ferrireducens]